MARKKAKKTVGKKSNVRAEKKMTIGERAGIALGIAGALLLLFGLFLFLMPLAAIDTVILLFGFVLVASGMLKLFEALFVIKGAEYSGYLAAGGALCLLIGLLILSTPQYAATGVFLMFGALAFLIALIAIVSGAAQIVYALKAKDERMMHLVLGAVLAALGIGILYNPVASAVGMAMLIGIFSVFYGAVMLLLAGQMKKILG